MTRARIQRRTERTGPARSGPCALALALTLGLGLVGAGCRLVRTATQVPGHAVHAMTPGRTDQNTVDPVKVQQTLMRVADEFASLMTLAVDRLQRGTNALRPGESLQWKIAIATESYSIAAGPNANTSLLDLTVFITVVRSALEEYWEPKVFGESARPMLDNCRQSETNVWRLAGHVLKPEQLEELRRAIEAWRQANTQPENVLAARALGFTSRIAELRADATNPGSVFSFLNMDPLAGMDPAVRELAQTRLFAERALFVTQRLPTLLRWQADLLAVRTSELPAVQQLVTNSTQLTAAIDRFATVAEKLPGQISAERREILKALESQEQKLVPVVAEVHRALTAGGQMSTSLNTTITTFDALMKRFGVGEARTAAAPGTNAEPFRIQNYGQTAVQLEGAARQLTELLRTLDQTLGSTNLGQLSAQVSPAVQKAQTSGKEVVDYAFHKAILLVLLVLVAVLIHRFLGARLMPKATSNSP